MKKSLLPLVLVALGCVSVLPSCTAVVDPTPNTAEQTSTTSTTVDPYSGTATQRKTTTTRY